METNYWQFLFEHFFLGKTKIKKKRARNSPLKMHWLMAKQLYKYFKIPHSKHPSSCCRDTIALRPSPQPKASRSQSYKENLMCNFWQRLFLALRLAIQFLPTNQNAENKRCVKACSDYNDSAMTCN